jgi:hypothetical protein
MNPMFKEFAKLMDKAPGYQYDTINNRSTVYTYHEDQRVDVLIFSPMHNSWAFTACFYLGCEQSPSHLEQFFSPKNLDSLLSRKLSWLAYLKENKALAKAKAEAKAKAKPLALFRAWYRSLWTRHRVINTIQLRIDQRGIHIRKHNKHVQGIQAIRDGR